MKIQDLSFQQELNLDETNIKGGLFNIGAFPIFQGQFTGQAVGAGAGGGIGSNTINSPALAVGTQIPFQGAAII